MNTIHIADAENHAAPVTVGAEPVTITLPGGAVHLEPEGDHLHVAVSAERYDVELLTEHPGTVRVGFALPFGGTVE